MTGLKQIDFLKRVERVEHGLDQESRLTLKSNKFATPSELVSIGRFRFNPEDPWSGDYWSLEQDRIIENY